jgi:hypothetical protein
MLTKNGSTEAGNPSASTRINRDAEEHMKVSGFLQVIPRVNKASANKIQQWSVDFEDAGKAYGAVVRPVGRGFEA